MKNYELIIKGKSGIKIFNTIASNSAEGFKNLRSQIKGIKFSKAKFHQVDFVSLN